MQIKFVATKKMPTWRGAGGLWRDGLVQELPDHVANRLLCLYESPFVKVGGKSISPASDKMIHEAPEVKESVSGDFTDKKPEKPRESLLKKKWGKRKKK